MPNIETLDKKSIAKEIKGLYRKIWYYLSYVNSSFTKYSHKIITDKPLLYNYNSIYTYRENIIKEIGWLNSQTIGETMFFQGKEKEIQNILNLIDLLYPLSIAENYAKLEEPQVSHFGNTKGIVMAPDFDEPLDDFLDYR